MQERGSERRTISCGAIGRRSCAVWWRGEEESVQSQVQVPGQVDETQKNKKGWMG